MTEPERIRKVAAILTRTGSSGEEVLVFDHPTADGGVMVQVPAGTVEQNEAPEAAVLRELAEESGITGALVSLTGMLDEEYQGQSRRRWVYLLRAPTRLPDEWPHTCDCGAAVRVHWTPLEQAKLHPAQQPWLDNALAWRAGHLDEVRADS